LIDLAHRMLQSRDAELASPSQPVASLAKRPRDQLANLLGWRLWTREALRNTLDQPSPVGIGSQQR
jgi:hypothetical protein